MVRFISRWFRHLIICLCLLSFLSCLTQKKREDIAYRWIRENPDKFAAEASRSFPITTKPGIPKIILDTAYLVKKETQVIQDTVYVNTENTKVVTKTILQVDTFIDNALAEALMAAKFNVEKELERERQKVDTLTAENKKLWWHRFGLIAGIVIFVLGYTTIKYWVKIKSLPVVSNILKK